MHTDLIALAVAIVRLGGLDLTFPATREDGNLVSTMGGRRGKRTFRAHEKASSPVNF